MSTCESPFTASFPLSWNGVAYVGTYASQIPQGKAVRAMIFISSSTFIQIDPRATSFVKIGGIVVDQFQGSGPAGPYYMRANDTLTVLTIGVSQGQDITVGLYGDVVPENTEIVFPQARSIVANSVSSSAPAVLPWQYPFGNIGATAELPGGPSGTTYQPATNYPINSNTNIGVTVSIPINVVSGSPSQNQSYYLHAVSVGGMNGVQLYPFSIWLTIELFPVSGLGLQPTVINCGLGWTPLGFSINTIEAVNITVWPAQTITVAANQIASINVILYTSPVMILGAIS
jgi:hypothetical protein